MHEDKVYLGLGSNLGDRVANLRAGIAGLRDGGLRLRALSSFYLTEPDLRPTSTASRRTVGKEPRPTSTAPRTTIGTRSRPTSDPGPSRGAGPSPHPPYVNCAAEFETRLDPAALLELCLAVEATLGRRRADDDGVAGPLPRQLDIDVLMIGQQIIDAPGLKIPHPLMMQRRFVLQPLAEIAPSLLHPLTQCTIAEALAALPDGSGVELLEPAREAAT